MKKSLAVVALSALISLASNAVFAVDAMLPDCVVNGDVVSLPTGVVDGSCKDTTTHAVRTFKDGKEVEAPASVDTHK